MFSGEADENIKLFAFCTSDIIDKYRAKFTEKKEEFKATMFECMRTKDNEIEELQSTMQKSQYETNASSKALLKDFEKRKKDIIHNVKEMTADSEEEDLHQLDLLDQELDNLAEQLIEVEVNQSEAFWEIIEEFIPNYKELDCTSKIQNFFKKLKKIEEKYSIELRDRLLDQTTAANIDLESNDKVKDVSHYFIITR